jgi:hypothetical protein
MKQNQKSGARRALATQDYSTGVFLIDVFARARA